MHYDRTMIAAIQERRVLEKATRNALTKLALMLNEWHSLNHKYFPTESEREDYRELLRVEIMKTSRSTPKPIRNKVKGWLRDVSAWREDVDRLEFIR